MFKLYVFDVCLIFVSTTFFFFTNPLASYIPFNAGGLV